MQQYRPADHPLQQWQEAIWLLIALITPLFVNFWVEQQFEASKVWLLRTLVWILAVMWLSNWVVGLQPKSLPSSSRNLGILLVLVLTLSTALSANHTVAIFGTLDRANGVLTQITYLLLFGCVATQIDPPRSRQLLSIIIITAIPICLLGLAQAAGRQPLPLFTDARSLMTTTLGRANFTGAYLALLLPLTCTAALAAARRWQRMGYGALFGIEVIVIALTGARAAWIAAVVGMGVLFWLHNASGWTRRVRWRSALGGGVVLAGALLLILERGIAAGGSIAARWTIWQASLRLLWPRLWLGYGADSLELHFPSVYPPQLVYYQGRGVVVDRAHNWLLDWSLNYGIVAAILFIVLVAAILREGWQRLGTSPNDVTSQSSEKPLAKPWLAACMAGICAQLVGNLFLFEVAATAVVFWLLLAIVTATATKENTLKTLTSLPLWSRGGVIAAGALIMSLAVWQSNLDPLLADVHSWRGTRALLQRNPAEALAEYGVAVKYQPHRIGYHVAVALTAAQLGRFDEAERAIRKAVALRPTDPVLYTQLATIYAYEAIETSGEMRMAYDSYEQAILLAPTIALTSQQYADLALRAGDGDVARRQALRAVDLDATDGLAFGILGWSHWQAGNLTAAQRAFEQAVRWQPDSADFYLGLATVFVLQDRFEEACQALKRSLVLDPFYAPALTLQIQLQNTQTPCS